MSQTLTRPDSTAVDERAVSLIDRLFPPPRAFDVRLPDGAVLAGGSGPAFALVLNHPGALRRMLSPPIELSMGESFIYGDFDIEGDIFSAFSVIDKHLNRKFSLGDMLGILRDVLALPRSGPARPAGRGPARLRGRLHSRERDFAAIRYHYDVGNDFFALWLDRRMQYSCAYFPTGNEDLDTAQELKLEHICRKLRLQPGERLLDIGCGWGGLAKYAAEKYGGRVLGVTLSENQANYARSGLPDGVNIELRDYRDLDGASFDKIVSVGMFEHIGPSQLPVYFTQAFRLLKPGGLFLNHGISNWPFKSRHSGDVGQPVRRPTRWQKFLKDRIVGDGLFERRYIFPDGEVVPLSEAIVVAENAGFEVRDVENLREHYALTLRHWVDRLETRRDEATRITNEVAYRTWRLYMAAAAYGFETGIISINQTLLSKPAGGKSNLPPTRADLYTDVASNQ
jgi:cyclopropane-fatty-acyl-phospholipid synthase